MQSLDSIADEIRLEFDARTAARDRALSQARTLTRHCANAIRSVHREDRQLAGDNLSEAKRIASALRSELAEFPDLYYAGYTQDALKEFAEANIVYALTADNALPTPQDLELQNATYLNGLAEAAGELRRRCLDILRHGYSQEAERLLNQMEDIYAVLTSMDYPDAITNGLRRQTDIARNIIEKTRGDITFSLRGEHLERAIARLSEQMIGEAGPSGPTLSRAGAEEE